MARRLSSFGQFSDHIRLYWTIAATGTTLLVSAPAAAQETKSYRYDVLGRLIEVDVTAGANSGVQVDMTYDRADNRQSVTVAGAQGPSSPTVIVVPLGGMTVIPVNQ